MTRRTSKADLHLHSRYSDRSAEWLFRRFEFPDSVSEPLDLYQSLKQKGMSYVTLTDHNTIAGCLEIAEEPDTFLSVEATAYFPEDRQRAHLLIWHLTETQFREIERLRENIYDLQKFLATEKLAHAVAHPLFPVGKPLSCAHFEKLILLFRHFEGINGLRDAAFGDLASFILEQLDPGQVDEIANRHGFGPTHEEAWKKVFTGGSDDHGGLFPGSAWTETTPVENSRAFTQEVLSGNCSAHGKGGSPIALSHSLYNTFYSFVSEKYVRRAGGAGSELVEKAFSRFMEGKNPTQFSLSEKIGFVTQGIISGKIFELAKPGHASLWRELSDYLSREDVQSRMDRETRGIKAPEERAFIIANLLANQLVFQFFNKFVRQISNGNLMESLQAISAMAPVGLMLGPYIYAFQSQTAPQKWMRETAAHFRTDPPVWLQNRKRAWFTDTLDDVNGVATTIRKMTAAGVEQGCDLVVVACRSEIGLTDIPIKNFEPIGEFELPEYELQKLTFPPVLQMLDYIRREGFTELIISTPGPVGLTALLAAKMFGLRAVGIYHTDFPQYVRILTDDSFLESLTWNFMHWFYDQLDLLYVNSDEYRKSWINRKIDPAKIQILPRGLDTDLFKPARRDPEFWNARGGREGEVRLLYVGRISKEKDLDVLATAYERLLKKGKPVRLFFVGDGPYLSELQHRLPEAVFTGYLQGEELAVAYASSDVFAFPSTTDTFGNVILEAQASGLPAVVSDEGGPVELVEHERTGLVTKALDVSDFTAALERLVDDPDLRQAIGTRSREKVSTRSWPNAFKMFWETSPL